MRAGLLRHMVTLQERVTTDDGAGGVTEEWVDADFLPARVVPLAGTELFSAQQVMPLRLAPGRGALPERCHV